MFWRRKKKLTDDLKAMLAVLPETVAGSRDRALLLLGFAGAFRRSEARALRGSGGELAREETGERGFDDFGAADQLDLVRGVELQEGLQCAGDGGLGGEVAPHRIQRDPCQR